MSQIKQLLRLHQQGAAKKQIARTLDISRNTVRAYLDKISGAEWAIPELLAMEDPELLQLLHAGSPAYKDQRYRYFKERLEYFTAELDKVGVTRMLLWEEYRQVQPEGYGYSQFCHHLSQHLDARKPTMVLTHLPADKLYMDYAGNTIPLADPQTGQVTQCQVFVACLPFSDYSFAMAVKTQQVEDFVYALSCCLTALGGVPKALVPDNLKSAIIRASRYEPDINRVLEDLANHYGCTVVPTRIASPKDKALVENQVKLVYNRVYARLRNQKFFDLHSLNQAIAEKIDDHNQTRMQQKPYCRQERFLAKEKPLLRPLPAQRYELKYYRTYTVARSSHIYLGQDKHYYSVPFRFIGKKVQVIYTRTLVRVYCDGSQMAVHHRDPRPGRYSTKAEHLCPKHQHYLQRSPEYYLGRARRVAPVLETLFEQIFAQDRYPEQLYRICEGLLALSRKTDPDEFAAACSLAIEHQAYSWRFIDNLLKNRMVSRQEPQLDIQLPRHGNVRGRDYYKQPSNL